MSEGLSLVTGSAGFIGRRLMSTLCDRKMATEGWTRATVDLRDRKAVASKLRELRPTRIFHLASASAALSDTDWRVAFEESQMLANLAYAAPADCRIIYTGSVSEYGYSGTHGETDRRCPRSLYGFAKAITADLAVSLATQGIGDVRVARLFNVYGPGEAAQRLVPHLVANLMAERPVPLRGRYQTRDYIHVDDVCDRLIVLSGLDLSPYPVVNIGTGVATSLEYICERVAALLGRSASFLDFDALAPRPIDDDFLVSDTTRTASLGQIPKQHWRDSEGPAVEYVTSLSRKFS